jgi:hypothetical protein
MICPNCKHVFLPKLAHNPGLAFVKQHPLAGQAHHPPDSVWSKEAWGHWSGQPIGPKLRFTVVICPRCFYHIETSANTIAYEDCHNDHR